MARKGDGRGMGQEVPLDPVFDRSMAEFRRMNRGEGERLLMAVERVMAEAEIQLGRVIVASEAFDEMAAAYAAIELRRTA